MRVLLIIGLAALASCSLIADKRPNEVEEYIKKLREVRQDAHAGQERWIEIPMPKPRS